MWIAVERSSCQRLFQSSRAVESSADSVRSRRCRRGITPWNESGERSADLASFAARGLAIERRRRRTSSTSRRPAARSLSKEMPSCPTRYYNPFVNWRGEMPHFLSRAGQASVVLLEVIALVWIGKKALELATRTRFREELMVKDNPAAGVAFAGFYLALFLALSGLLSGEPGPLLLDLRLTAVHGAVAIAAIVLCTFAWSPLVRVSLREDILAQRNLGAGIVTASVLVATGLV